MNRQVGKVSWDSPVVNIASSSREEVKKIPFINMNGYNKSWKLRVVSEEPLHYLCHFTVDKNGKPIKVNCSLTDDCPVMVERTKTQCQGTQAESRFYLKVIDREDNKVKVLDVGRQIVNAIGSLISNPDWGHCKDYDIKIIKGKEGSNPLYKVEPSPHKPLSSEEEQMVMNSENPEHEDYIDLESRTKPTSVEVLNKILKGGDLTTASMVSSKKNSSSFSGTTTQTTSTKTASKPTTTTRSSSEESFEVDWDDVT